MDPAVVATLVVSVCVAIGASITAPLILARQAERMHRQDREADWARQDKMAADARAKLDVIHTIVDGGITASMRAELDATVRELATMREVVDLKRALGQEPTPEALTAIEATRVKVAELSAKLADREAAVAKAEEQEARDE